MLAVSLGSRRSSIQLNMAECTPYRDAREAAIAGRRGGICEGFLLGLVALTLIRAGEALAGDQTSIAIPGKLEQKDLLPSTALSATLFPLPGTYSIPSVPESKAFSTKDFRPHGRSLFEGPKLNVTDDALIDDTTVWQRLADYRIHNRFQVLTLWKSGASTVSLQAGKGGGPTLQWTSRLMNRGAATRGLLDRWFNVSEFSESSASRAARSTAQATGRAAVSLSLPHLGTSSLPP
jgi:hypothetical protein